MEIKPFKFIIKTVLLETEDGDPIGEQLMEEVVVYGEKGLLAWLENLKANIPTEAPTE
jgi:hypothetical protein